MESDIARNAATVAQELDWLASVLENRLSAYFEQRDWPLSEPPQYQPDDGPYAQLVLSGPLAADERLVLILALAPHVRPQVLDSLFIVNRAVDRPFTEFGGVQGKNHKGFLPTCETAAFLLGGNDLARRFDAIRLFQNDHLFARLGVLQVEAEVGDGGPQTLFSGVLSISGEYLQLLTTGVRHKPDFNSRFPAKLITTALNWQDLVLAPEVREEIGNLQTWLAQGQRAMRDWGLEKHVKPGYRALFYGPPGTGKTLTATLIGATVGMDVYRIDLSMLVSKYIGETEKNLAGVFNQAENKNWVLFFDEADALFGRRTQTSSSNDRHANQEISYLLQRIEDFPGVIILASNLRANIDEAFARRFQCAIYFPMPDAEQRLALWRGVFDAAPRLAPDVDLEWLAEEFVLAGGAITNVARYAVLRAIGRQRDQVTRDDLLAGIGKELVKEGKAAS